MPEPMERQGRHFQEELEHLKTRLREMRGRAEQQGQLAVQARVDRAPHGLHEDDKLDSLETRIFRDLLTYMLQDAGTSEAALDLILIPRHLEPIGEHATNIAEDVIFMVSARDVRHHADESQPSR